MRTCGRVETCAEMLISSCIERILQFLKKVDKSFYRRFSYALLYTTTPNSFENSKLDFLSIMNDEGQFSSNVIDLYNKRVSNRWKVSAHFRFNSVFVDDRKKGEIWKITSSGWGNLDMPIYVAKICFFVKTLLLI